MRLATAALCACAAAACRTTPDPTHAAVEALSAPAQDTVPPAVPPPAGSSPGGAADSTQPAWQPPMPDEDADDWVRMNSGEWLRGEAGVLRNDVLEFESEELDNLKLDWGDVAELRAPRIMTLGLTEQRVVTGTVMVHGDDVAVRVGDRVEHYTREELLAIIPGRPTESNWWSGEVSLGMSIRKGNTNQADHSADVRVRRRTPGSRVELGYNGVLTRVESQETSNAHRFDGRWDRFLTRRFYVSPLFFDAFNDRFQNIDWRVTPGAGVGYQIIDSGGVEWDVDGGVGYQYLRYDSVEPGEPETQESAALIAGTSVDMDLTEKVELYAEYRVQAALNSDVGTNQHAKATVSVDLVGELDLDVTVIWDRVGKPVADADGVVPKNDDYRMQVGLGWSF